MATHHASPSEIVDLETWAHDLPNSHAKTIVKTNEMELARLVFSAGEEFPNHKVAGPVVVHCINGEIEFTAMGETQNLKPDQLVYLMPDESHSIYAIADAVVLLTIIFKV